VVGNFSLDINNISYEGHDWPEQDPTHHDLLYLAVPLWSGRESNWLNYLFKGVRQFPVFASEQPVSQLVCNNENDSSDRNQCAKHNLLEISKLVKGITPFFKVDIISNDPNEHRYLRNREHSEQRNHILRRALLAQINSEPDQE
jgi:hypothetical protein